MDSDQLQLVKQDALSVSDYASQLRSALRQVGGAILEGEVQEPSVTRGGMLFFDLTDGRAVLGCKVFPHVVKRLKQRPKHGDLVRVVVDRPDLHGGSLKLAVSSIELAGVGALLLKRAELLKRLKAAGFTDSDRWKPRPWLPRAVGVIAGRDSKGLTDVVRSLVERFPPVSVVACPALVQGLKAPRDLIDALAHLEEDRQVDVIVLARGGGSVQDLVAFDDEGLCKAVFACSTPVIAAVGHTDNVPVVNHVTWSASTPSRAPELAVPSAKELLIELEGRRQRLTTVRTRLGLSSDWLASAATRIEIDAGLKGRATAVREVGSALERSQERVFVVRERGLEQVRAGLCRVPLRLPKAELLADPRARLDAAVRALFRDQAISVARQWDALRTPGGQALERLGTGIDEQAKRVTKGAWRELADHERDYRRAIERLVQQCHQGLARILDRHSGEIGHRGEALLPPGLRLLEVRLREIDEQADRLDLASRLSGWAGEVREAGSGLERAGERVLATRERGLEQARGSLGQAPLRLPKAELLADPRARLDAAVRALFRDRSVELQRRLELLFVPGPQAFERRLRAVREHGGRIGTGTRRGLADHERDYGRATQRLASEARQNLERGLAGDLRELELASERLLGGVTTHLTAAQREAAHLTALIKALDQRSRGWVLPQDEAGRMIKFPPGAAVGTRFSLNFKDGRQWVVADKIEFEEDSK